MGTLKPDTRYIYESPDNGKTIYAREVGSTEKKLIGYQYQNNIQQKKLFEEILLESENNEQLKNALENVKVIYYLSKQNES